MASYHWEYLPNIFRQTHRKYLWFHWEVLQVQVQKKEPSGLARLEMERDGGGTQFWDNRREVEWNPRKTYMEDLYINIINT